MREYACTSDPYEAVYFQAGCESTLNHPFFPELLYLMVQLSNKKVLTLCWEGKPSNIMKSLVKKWVRLLSHLAWKSFILPLHDMKGQVKSVGTRIWIWIGIGIAILRMGHGIGVNLPIGKASISNIIIKAQLQCLAIYAMRNMGRFTPISWHILCCLYRNKSILARDSALESPSITLEGGLGGPSPGWISG